MKKLTKADILNCKRRQRICEVPEWNGAVYLFEMNCKERAEFREGLPKGDNGTVTFDAASIFIQAAHDEKGEKMFSAEDEENIRTNLSAAVIERVAAEWLELNGLTASSVESAEKN